MRTDVHGRTHRLELADQTLREWDATVLARRPGAGHRARPVGLLPRRRRPAARPRRAALGRRADPDRRRAQGRRPVPAPGRGRPAAAARARRCAARSTTTRRTALMRTHSGLHVLSGVVFRDFGALVTGGNMEPLTRGWTSTCPRCRRTSRTRVAEACNAEVAADRAIEVSDAAARRGVRDYPTSSAPRPTCCRPTSRWCGSSTSSGWTPRPTAARTSRRRADRPDRGRQDREQGQGLPPAAGAAHRLNGRTRVSPMEGSCVASTTR